MRTKGTRLYFGGFTLGIHNKLRRGKGGSLEKKSLTCAKRAFIKKY